MIPVFSIVGGSSNIGKTTILCGIVKELKIRGYRVCTIKHDAHGFDIDHPGKDTWKHSQAGADTVIISSPLKMAMIEKTDEEYSLDQIIDKVRNVDIIITEGYKKENKPKLEVLRKGVVEEISSKDEELFAIVCDTNINKNIPQFCKNDFKGITDLIEDKFLKQYRSDIAVKKREY